MKNHAQKLIEATEKHTLRPKKGDRARVIIEVLRYLCDDFSDYSGSLGRKIIEPREIEYLIQDLYMSYLVEYLEIEND